VSAHRPEARPVALAVALALLVFPGAAQATLSWSGPIELYSGFGSYSLACPSGTQCTAAQDGGKQVTFNPRSPGTPAPATIDAGNGVFALACPSSTQCTAVDAHGQEVTFNPSSPGTPTPAAIDSGNVLHGVACPSSTQCTAVDYYNGQELTFNPISPGTPAPTTIDSGSFLTSIACPAGTQCTAVDSNGQEVTFNPGSPGTPAPGTVDAGNYLYAVACPSSTQCTAVDDNGQEVTFNPGSPGTPAPVTIDSNSRFLFALACPTGTQCTAVDIAADAVTFDPSSPGAGTLEPLVGASTLTGVSCSSETLCVAVDGSGHAFVGTSVLYSTASCLGSPGHTVLEPVKPDGSSVFKLGSTIPVKFRVCDSNGVPVGTAGIVSGSGAPVLYSKTNGTGGVDEPVYSTTPDTAFRWDVTSQQWIFNQSTENLTSGVVYTYRINLNDGSYIQYTFGVK
jgi:hypothetical protein